MPSLPPSLGFAQRQPARSRGDTAGNITHSGQVLGTGVRAGVRPRVQRHRGVPGDCLSSPRVLAYSRPGGSQLRGGACVCSPDLPSPQSRRTHGTLPERRLTASTCHRRPWLRDFTQLSFLKHCSRLPPREREVRTQAGTHTRVHCLAPQHSQCLVALLLPPPAATSHSQESLRPPAGDTHIPGACASRGRPAWIRLR